MLDRIINWFSVEPAVSVLMIATAIVLFGFGIPSLSGNSRGFLALDAAGHRSHGQRRPLHRPAVGISRHSQ